MQSSGSQQNAHGSPEWLSDGGQMGELIRAKDWSLTPLGPRQQWPESLRVAVNLILPSRFPMAILWGKELISIHNDACAAIAAERFDKVMGLPVSEVWPELRGFGEPIFAAVLRGETIHIEDQLFRLVRHGALEEVYMTASYSPIRDEGGQVAGTLVAMLETTPRVAMERQLREAKETLEAQVAQRTAELAVSQERLRLFVEYTPAAVAMFDQQMRYLAASRRWMSDYGLGAANIIGRSHYEVFPEVSQRWKEIHQRCLAGAVEKCDEDPFPRAGGQIDWVRWEIRPWHYSDGRIGGIIMFTEVITERKRAEEALQESERRLQRSQAIAHLGAWELDLPGNHLSWSDEVYRIFGLMPQEFPATYEAFLEAVHPDDRAAVDAAYTTSLREGRDTYEIQHRIVRRHTGEVRWVQEKCEHVRNAEGKIIRSQGMVLDVTEQELAQEAVAQSERRFRAVFDHAGVGIIVADQSYHFIAANERACRILGYSREQLLQMTVHQLTYHEDRARSDELNAAIGDGRLDRLDYEKRYMKGDGSPLWVHVTVSPVRDEQGKWQRAIATVEDISQRKRAEEQLEAARLSAETASKAKDHFLAVLSHELRTPLNPVLAAAAMLRDDPRFDADTREQLEVICRNAQMEAHLIDDLLDVTRIERGKIELHREPIDLATVIRQAVEVSMPDIKARKLTFGIDLPEQALWVDGDAGRLQEVFWNLIKNAVKFTPAGGRVGVCCRPDGGAVVTEVTDTGEGIDPGALNLIFNAFEQAERSITRQFGGLGLGLAISKALVEMHGGSISAHSAGKGKGATFRVRLPMCPAPAPARAPAPAAAAPGAAEAPSAKRQLQILLVEDHGDTARIMSRLLSREGHEVQTAGDVAMALSLAERQRFDLLLSDLGLPDGSGLELLRTLRNKGMTLPAIALSGYGQESDLQASRDAGFVSHLVKPVSLTMLKEAIDRLRPANH